MGDEQFDAYVPLLAGKRVALFSNHTGIVGDEISESDPPDVDRHFGLDASGMPLVCGEHILDAMETRAGGILLGNPKWAGPLLDRSPQRL